MLGAIESNEKGRHVEEVSELMGPDPYRYGFTGTRDTVAAFLGMSHDQGLTPSLLAPEDLFVAALRST